MFVCMYKFSTFSFSFLGGGGGRLVVVVVTDVILFFPPFLTSFQSVSAVNVPNRCGHLESLELENVG